jgi:hypothetical protein
VYEFVPTEDREAPEFLEEFLCDKERGKDPSAREQRHPELHECISAFRTRDDACRRWEQIAERVGADRVRLGPWIAKLRLEPGNGFKYDDSPDPTGHVYVKGAQLKLVEAVVEVTHVQGTGV